MTNRKSKIFLAGFSALLLFFCAEVMYLYMYKSMDEHTKEIKREFPGLKVVTPGIRNPSDTKGDQKRVATASLAFANGADYIVVGRPIIEKSDYLKAAEDILRG